MIAPREALERKAQPLFTLSHIPSYKPQEPRVFGAESEIGVVFTKKALDEMEKQEIEETAYLTKHLSNFNNELGARLYGDMGHPEFCTYETLSPCETVLAEEAVDRVGFHILIHQHQIAKVLYKHTTDYGNPQQSFGYHERYSTSLSFGSDTHNDLMALTPHLITRIIYTGAGALTSQKTFCISQRTPFILRECTAGTRDGDRGIICTKHDNNDRKGIKSMHIICGDATRSLTSRLLNRGTTALALDLAEENKIPGAIAEYDTEKAVNDFHGINAHPFTYRLLGYPNKNITAIDVQQMLLDSAAAEFTGRDEQTDLILRLWDDTLTKLQKNPLLTVGRIDYITKYALYCCLDNKFPEIKDEEMFWMLRKNDMDYHDLNPETSLYAALEREGVMELPFTATLVYAAMRYPPTNTRANFRAKWVRKLREVSGLDKVLEYSEWDKCLPHNDLKKQGISVKEVHIPNAAEGYEYLFHELCEKYRL